MFIQRALGQDIGQYLNGSLSNIDGAKGYTHSSYAYNIMRSLVIARISNKHIKEENLIMVHSKNLPFKEKSF